MPNKRFQAPHQSLVGVLLSLIGGFCAGLVVGAIWDQPEMVKLVTALVLSLVTFGIMVLSETGIL